MPVTPGRIRAEGRMKMQRTIRSGLTAVGAALLVQVGSVRCGVAEVRHWDNVPLEILNKPGVLPSGWKRVDIPEKQCSIGMPTEPQTTVTDAGGTQVHILSSEMNG